MPTTTTPTTVVRCDCGGHYYLNGTVSVCEACGATATSENLRALGLAPTWDENGRLLTRDLAAMTARVQSAVEQVKHEILADIASGVQPADVDDFSTLHDYVDANCYGGMCDPEQNADFELDEVIAVQDAVHAWLQAGRPDA